MSDKSCSGGSECTIPQCSKPVHLNPIAENTHAITAVCLQCSFESIDWSEDHSERSCCRRREDGLEQRGETAEIGIGLEKSEDACVGSGISESGYGT